MWKIVVTILGVVIHKETQILLHLLKKKMETLHLLALHGESTVIQMATALPMERMIIHWTRLNGN